MTEHRDTPRRGLAGLFVGRYERRKHRRVLTVIVCLLAMSELALAIGFQRSQANYRRTVYRACVLRNQQWDAVVAKERALLANARTLAVIHDVKAAYEQEIGVLESTRVNCDDLRASNR